MPKKKSKMEIIYKSKAPKPIGTKKKTKRNKPRKYKSKGTTYA